MTQPTRKLAAIVFTDIVEFTQITAQDEAAAMSLLKWQRERFKPLVSELGGEWLKEVGDGLLLSFPSSQDAVRCAIRIQEAAQEVPNLKMRIGIHQGDIIQEGPDILGDGVNIASRIQEVALRGGIALSEKVQQDISGYPEFEVISLGQKSLKGIARPMEIYALSPFGLPEIPEYRLLRLTGQGAYGEVWLAQSLTGVYRAVKIVHRDQFEDAKPYEREFTGITGYEPISRKHEGLIDLLHVGHGENDSFFYYVMELADDQRAREEINPREYRPRTLQSELEARGKLSIGECLEVGSRLARGLAFLHDHNLLHRDVKPANIVYVDGQPRLADIGLVTTMDNASTLVGTMGYIPPEGPGKPSSDIYALGMVLYELSTGKDRADFPEIDVLDSELKGLNQACLKACSRDTAERFPDAHAFADELDQLAQGKATTDSASSPPQASNLKTGALAVALTAILVIILYQKFAEDPGAPGPPTKGLVAYYPFNGNAKDASGNGNDGEVKGPSLTLEPTLTLDRHDKADSAYEFTGKKDSRIEIQETDTLKLQKMTLNSWVYLSKVGVDEVFIILAREESFQWVIDNNSKSRAKNYFGLNKGGFGSWENLEYTGRFPAEEWFMYTATYDGLIMRQYLNSQEICSLPFTGAVPYKPRLQKTFMLAGVGRSPRSDLTNKLDDLRIYNYALSAEEIAALYASESNFENTLGMKFVPVPGTDVQFCIWETRVQDYAAYAAANEGVNAKWKEGDGHRQSATCPVVWVDWNEARAFCAWLTKKEQAAGKLKPGQRYRLPTDAEWSVAVGLGKETGNTPMEKRDGIKGIYPWGKEYPAPKGAGNYYGSMRVDSFSWTSPVGSFAANALGIHDLGGNVWEWCEDKMTPTSTLRVMRGSCWHNYALGSGSLLSAARNKGLPDKTDNVIGFRVVLEKP